MIIDLRGLDIAGFWAAIIEYVVENSTCGNLHAKRPRTRVLRPKMKKWQTAIRRTSLEVDHSLRTRMSRDDPRPWPLWPVNP